MRALTPKTSIGKKIKKVIFTFASLIEFTTERTHSVQDIKQTRITVTSKASSDTETTFASMENDNLVILDENKAINKQ